MLYALCSINSYYNNFKLLEIKYTIYLYLLMYVYYPIFGMFYDLYCIFMT